MKKAPVEPKRPGLTQAMLEWHQAVPNDRIAHLVRDARRGFGRCLQLRLQQRGVALGHWTFLRILWVRDGLTQRELSDLAGVMEPTTFAALRTMEGLGYIKRQRRHDNRKNIYVYLTDEGRALRDQLVPLAQEINDMAVEDVSAEDLAATRRVLNAMISALLRYESKFVTEKRRVPLPGELTKTKTIR